MEDLKNCPVCANSLFESYLKCIDYTVTQEEFSLVKCIKCGFVFTNPRPDKNEINRYYESDDYISHSNTNKGLINKIYHLVKVRAIRSKIQLIAGLSTKNKSILDIGCGTGDFLAKAKESGWKITGVEPNEKARIVAIKNCNSNIYNEAEMDLLANNSFSIISMWHVLEHVHDLKNRVSDIYKLLENGGFTIIAIPNLTSWDAKHYREKWAAYDVPRHLYHFSPEIIKILFLQYGFKHIRSLPMKMDAFYVSMLSEKYKKSSLGLIRAFIVGLLSNLKTKNDAEKYSSVIYIFQK